MQNAHTALGRYGEEVAARRLAEEGLQVLERNWRCSEGELDIIVLDGDTVAVCEVKTRSERGFQQPAEAIGTVKAQRLRHLAERWLSERWPEHFVRLAEGVARAVPLPGGTAAAPPVNGSSSGPVSGPVNGPVSGPVNGPAPAAPAPPVTAVPLPPGGVRIDLVSVVSRARGAARIEHLRGVI
ncbi:YraN family protein [Kitasatospora sp. NPDC008050]|uniref:YraN family protein n=1 Tax=Kitasatospora sp. NPDC008050 TaxID=3364021 RepID=UPI0036E5EDB3